MSTVASFSRIRRAIVLALVLLLALQRIPESASQSPVPKGCQQPCATGRWRWWTTSVDSTSPVQRRILSHCWASADTLHQPPQTHAGRNRG